MARVMMLPPNQPAKNRVIFINDFAVGPGCPNKRDDVMLVQFMLGAIGMFSARPENSRYDYAPSLAPRNLAPDGVCGPYTIAYIKSFQNQGSLAYAPGSPLRMIEDGLVSPVKKGVPWSAGGHALTMVRMNKVYVDLLGANAHLDPAQWFLMPFELRTALFMN
jgi:hypothetical protein